MSNVEETFVWIFGSLAVAAFVIMTVLLIMTSGEEDLNDDDADCDDRD